MNTTIHPSAVVMDGAEIGAGCDIGPFCYIGPDVRLGQNCKLQAHVVIDGHTTLGDDNEVYSFACLGKKTQDLKDDGEVSYVEVGNGNVFREYTTINAATAGGDTTRVGDNCHILSYSHIAHDCTIGNNVIISSSFMVAGHVTIEDNAIISGLGGIVQFVRVGAGSFIGGFTKLAKDLLPYTIAEGIPAETRSINKVGMERRGMSKDEVKAAHQAFKTILRSGLTVEEAAAELRRDYADYDVVEQMVAFAESSTVGLARPKAK